MKYDDLEKEFNSLFEKCKDILFTKNKEYARAEDALYQFKNTASQIGASPEQAIAFGLTKHMNSILSYIRDGKVHSNESIEDRIADAINYLGFLYAFIHEGEIDMKEFEQKFYKELDKLSEIEEQRRKNLQKFDDFEHFKPDDHKIDYRVTDKGATCKSE